MLFAGASGVLAQDNANLFWDDTNKRLGIGPAVPASKLHLSLSDAGTNAVVTVETVDHITSGTAANGFGAGRLWRLEDDGGMLRDAARESVLWATAAAGTRKVRRIWSVFDTEEREGLRLDTDGAVAYVSMLGDPPASATLSKLGLGSAIVGGDADGTGLGMNFASGYAGDFIHLQSNGTKRFGVNQHGHVFIAVDTNDQGKIVFGAADTSHPGLVSVGSELQLLDAVFLNFVTFRAGSIMANGTLQAVGVSSQIGINKRSDNLQAWALYSQSGELNFFDSNGSTERWIMASGTGTLIHTVTDAATNAVTVVHTLGHNTSGSVANGFGSQILFRLEDSTDPDQDAGAVSLEWADKTHASRSGRGKLWANYTTTPRECLRFEADGTNPLLGVLGANAIARQTVTGSRGGNAALASFLTAMASFGWITDSTSA